MIPAEVGLACCNKLFFLEKLFRDLTSGRAKKDRRLETEVPVWEKLLCMVGTTQSCKRSKLEKAADIRKKYKEPLPLRRRIPKGQWTIRWIIHRLRFTNF